MNNSGRSLISVVICALHILLICAKPVDIIEEEETEFVRLYGDEYDTSGIWEPVRSFAQDRDRLANISLQAHVAARLGSLKDEVSAAIFLKQTLMFYTPGLDKNVKIDLIKYHIVRAIQNYIWITKGLKPGCVHFLIRLDGPGTLFYLGKHVCGITF